MGDNARLEEISVKTTLPPSPVVTLPESSSPIKEGETRQFAEGSIRPTESPANAEERQKRKNYLVTALDRGVINDRMCVPLPPHLHGEWVRRDPFEIDQMQKLGFKIDNEFAPKRSLHGDGTGAAFVGDVVFMITEKWNKELIDEVKHERFLAVHAKKGKEEKDFEVATRNDTGGVIPTMIESETRQARRESIADALAEQDNQTAPQTLP